jgi:hypothetical protein
MKDDPGRVVHRATYTLECGTWRATCRICGYQVKDAKRRQAASQFRLHIQRTYGVTDSPDDPYAPESLASPSPAPAV